MKTMKTINISIVNFKKDIDSGYLAAEKLYSFMLNNGFTATSNTRNLTHLTKTIKGKTYKIYNAMLRMYNLQLTLKEV